MNELFHDSPTFVPGSKWVPSSHIDEDARMLAEGGGKAAEVKEERVEYASE